ncbi:MAG: SDR family NAD(P)-dependent oxidoreductase, partial [Deltaproteobacteria bacterium]|nr:SDR family NAD(P)-dependent oxidoreductase [Deltaproteobacteria bacterium]
LVAETQHDPGAVEIGYADGRRWTIASLPVPVGPARPELALDGETVYVITGAAGSIVSEIASDLARTGGTFYLLDLAPEPERDNPDLARLDTDRDGLKRDLFERIKASGERATPAMVERQLATVERAKAAADAIAAIEGAGGTAHYVSLDLRDGDAVAAAIEQIRSQVGRIDVLLHAAGLEISHFLADKPDAEFDLVFGVKVDGWRNLLSAIGDMPLGATVSFSSIAGRFGNSGQTDYAAANELLARTTASFLANRPDTRGITIDWTAWADIGMASRGSIPKMMAMAGIDMLPPEIGIPAVRNELEAGTRGEVVIAGELGILLSEFDESGGLDISALPDFPRGPMNTTVVGMPINGGLQIETTLDPSEQPFLFDHRIDGTPVLPGVMGIEGFAEATRALFPEWRVAAVEDVEFLAPFKFYRDEPRTVTLYAQLLTDNGDLVAHCRLVGSRTLVGSDRPTQTTHFRARVRLTQAPASSQIEPLSESDNGAVEALDIYRVYFHDPAYQVLERAWRDNGTVIGEMRGELPANHSPGELETALDPRLVELCFQTAGVWQIGRTGKMGLPHRIDRVSVLATEGERQGPLYAVVTPSDDGDSFDAVVADRSGRVYVELSGYRTAELPAAIEPDKRRPLQNAMD